jgi:hypothetical protein
VSWQESLSASNPSFQAALNALLNHGNALPTQGQQGDCCPSCHRPAPVRAPFYVPLQQGHPERSPSPELWDARTQADGYQTPILDNERQLAWLDELTATPRAPNKIRSRIRSMSPDHDAVEQHSERMLREPSAYAYTNQVPMNPLFRQVCHNLSFLPANELLRVDNPRESSNRRI